MSFERPKPKKAERLKQQTPAEMVGSLMGAVRSNFYGEIPEKWFADQHFIKRNVVLWPANWLNEKGVTLPPERYKAIMLALFVEIKVNATGPLKYPPGFLMKCVQDHFRIQGEKYYDEGKTIRSKADLALLSAINAPRAADPVAALADAHRILTGHKRLKKRDIPARSQMSLL